MWEYISNTTLGFQPDQIKSWNYRKLVSYVSYKCLILHLLTPPGGPAEEEPCYMLEIAVTDRKQTAKEIEAIQEAKRRKMELDNERDTKKRGDFLHVPGFCCAERWWVCTGGSQSGSHTLSSPSSQLTAVHDIFTQRVVRRKWSMCVLSWGCGNREGV